MVSCWWRFSAVSEVETNQRRIAALSNGINRTEWSLGKDKTKRLLVSVSDTQNPWLNRVTGDSLSLYLQICQLLVLIKSRIRHSLHCASFFRLSASHKRWTAEKEQLAKEHSMRHVIESAGCQIPELKPINWPFEISRECSRCVEDIASSEVGRPCCFFFWRTVSVCNNQRRPISHSCAGSQGSCTKRTQEAKRNFQVVILAATYFLQPWIILPRMLCFWCRRLAGDRTLVFLKLMAWLFFSSGALHLTRDMECGGMLTFHNVPWTSNFKQSWWYMGHGGWQGFLNYALLYT